MSKPKGRGPAKNPDALFDRIVTILEQARGNVVRAVNTNMVLAYWLIGREIVQDLQAGEERAEYGKQVIESLSARMTERYGKGFSTPVLWNFRQFYLTYSDRTQILFPAGRELADVEKLFPPGRELTPAPIPYPSGTESGQVFSPQLSWSHYRALMRVEDPAAREFYEREAAECGWSKAQLERQIHTAYYQRILANRGPEGLLAANRDRLPGEPVDAGQMLKAPYVLEFLGLPDSNELHESALEEAIINNLQAFLLELGKGFSFVARQKHIRFGDDDFYVDLVFYNYILKCFLLIDLKMGKLTHQDVGQMDGYVRLYEDRFKVPGDNPTIGLILCADRSEAVAKYSVLSEGRRIFASKYMQFLPSEKELCFEIAKERRLIEAAMRERRELTGGNQE
ncbi:MAG: PDDEXK nuclease domain-containing protein [Desulfobacterales bacterium]|nr:PDDEXK nuclease domain-containing protein [Desulfobacterales bacterium]